MDNFSAWIFRKKNFLLCKRLDLFTLSELWFMQSNGLITVNGFLFCFLCAHPWSFDQLCDTAISDLKHWTFLTKKMIVTFLNEPITEKNLCKLCDFGKFIWKKKKCDQKAMHFKYQFHRWFELRSIKVLIFKIWFY